MPDTFRALNAATRSYHLHYPNYWDADLVARDVPLILRDVDGLLDEEIDELLAKESALGEQEPVQAEAS